MNFAFGWNEWFMIIASAFFFSLFLLIRKHFHPAMVVIVWVFSVTYVGSIDYFLIATPFNLYYFGQHSGYEAANALFHLVVYPCGALLLLYGYEKWQLYGKKAVWYILFWTAFSMFFEWLTLITHILTYTGWKLYYSIPTYPVSAVLAILLFRFSKKKLGELPSQSPQKT